MNEELITNNVSPILPEVSYDFKEVPSLVEICKLKRSQESLGIGLSLTQKSLKLCTEAAVQLMNSKRCEGALYKPQKTKGRHENIELMSWKQNMQLVESFPNLFDAFSSTFNIAIHTFLILQDVTSI